MSVGVEAIDNDHIIIISLIAKLIKVTHKNISTEALNDIFIVLEYYIVTHFHREETFMEMIGYHKLSKHKDSHKDFIDIVSDFKDQMLTDTSYDVAEWDNALYESKDDFLAQTDCFKNYFCSLQIIASAACLPE